VPVVVARLFGRGRTAVAVVFVVIVAAASVQQATHSASPGSVPVAMGTARRVLIDTPTRGVLPRVVGHLPPSAEVYARWQRPLAQDPAPWLDALRPGDLYVSFTRPPGTRPDGERSSGNSPTRQRALLRLLQNRFSLTALGSLPGVDNVTVWQLRSPGTGLGTGG